MATKETENPAPKLVNQPNAVPTNKVSAQAAGAVVAAVVMQIVQTYFGIGFEPGSAIHQGLPILFGLVMGYFMKDNANTPPVKGD